MNLIPFAPESLNVEVKLEPQASGFILSFRISGKSLSQIQLPEKNPKPCRTDELWKHTCFEAFFQAGGTESYFEFNGSPSGHWALYGFDRYRQGMKPVIYADPKLFPVMEKMERTDEEILCVWKIPQFTEAFLQKAGLTAVIVLNESENLRTTYWAIRHAGEQPDFHLKETFSHRLI